MERREFLAALGTAATVSSASQVFAQTGGGSPQKVNVAVYVALEAKPVRQGKESWLGKFQQSDKWSFCLTAARMAADQERDDDETSAPEPQPGIQGESGSGRHQGREDVGRWRSNSTFTPIRSRPFG